MKTKYASPEYLTYKLPPPPQPPNPSLLRHPLSSALLSNLSAVLVQPVSR
jgi:hypothetical protein